MFLSICIKNSFCVSLIHHPSTPSSERSFSSTTRKNRLSGRYSLRNQSTTSSQEFLQFSNSIQCIDTSYVSHGHPNSCPEEREYEDHFLKSCVLHRLCVCIGIIKPHGFPQGVKWSVVKVSSCDGDCPTTISGVSVIQCIRC